MRRVLALGLVACGAPSDDPDVPVDPCAPDGEPALAFGQQLALGAMEDGDPVAYGIPPQGGAPYVPVEVRVRADLVELERLPVVATVWDAEGEALGSASETRAFLCANVGPHLGWRYGGEVHARFDGWSLDALRGLAVTVEVVATLPDGTDVASSHPGTLAWTLGPGAEDVDGTRVP